MNKKFSVSEFKKKALGILKEIVQNGDTIIIEKHGKAIAKVIPLKKEINKPLAGKLKNTVICEKDLLSPLDPTEWNVLK